MKIGIYSLQTVLFEGEAEKVIAKTSMGEITVLEDHIPLISKLVKSTIRLVQKDGSEKLVPINSGVIEVRPRSKVIILAS